MAKRRDENWDMDDGRQARSNPKKVRRHRVSNSEPDDSSEDESHGGRFGDPSAFLRQFGGYASDDEKYDSDENEGWLVSLLVLNLDITRKSPTHTSREIEICFVSVPESNDDEDEEEEAEFSEDEEDARNKKVKKASPSDGQESIRRAPRIDFTKLPFLDNNGLSYLPRMQYFDVDEECPMVPGSRLISSRWTRLSW